MATESRKGREAREIRSHFQTQERAQLLCIITSTGAFHLGYYRLLMAPLIPRFIFFPRFHVSPVVVTGTVVVSVLGGSVGVTVSAGVLVSAHQNKKTAERRGGGSKVVA